MSSFKKKIGNVIGGDGFSSGAITAFFLAAVILLNVILYIVVELFGLYLYKVPGDDLSLSETTSSLFSSAEEQAKIDGNKVKISFCFAEENLQNHETGAFVYTTAKNFAERYPDLIELNYINIITMRDQNGILIEDFDRFKTDMSGNETPIMKTSVIFEYGSNYRVVTDTYTTAGYAPFFTLDSEMQATAYNGEEVMAGMISWVLHDEHKVAYFTQFHGEVADLAFSNLLFAAGYYIDVIDLRKKEVPDDAALLVISNPSADFERSAEGSGVRSELDRIEAYMERGGNLYVALDPYVKNLPVLEGFLSEWGLEFETHRTENGTVLRELVKDPRNAITTDAFTLVLELADNPLANKIDSTVKKYSKDANVIISSAGALKLSGNATPLLVSSSASVTEAGGVTVSRGGEYAVAAVSEESFGDKVGRVFLVPSMYLAVSDSLVTDGYANRDFLYSLFEEFFGGGAMPYGSRVVVYDTEVLRNLKLGTAKLYTALILAVPAAIAVTGCVMIVRRKYR